MRIEITDTLISTNSKRVLYIFHFDLHQGFRLVEFHLQERETNRHKWKGKKWDYMDERNYVSNLSRPTRIPSHVLNDARRHVSSHVFHLPNYIGWFNSNSELKV